MMTEAGGDQEAPRSNRVALAVLALAALLAVGAIGWKAWSARAPDAAGGEAGTAAAPTIDELRARAERSPGDAGPWQALAFAHFERGEFAAAATAYERAVEIDDGEAVLWSALGEARVMASEHDPMPRAALAAFRKAAELDPRDPRARYFLAVEKDLGGNHEGAIGDWLALLADTPPGAPWESDLVRTIEQVGKIHGISVTERLAAAQDGRLPAMNVEAPAVAGPTQEQLAAAGSIPPSEQRTMAESMVERLEQRLANDPANIDGWIMLMRSRMTLGQADRARQALADAITANPAQAARLRAEAEKLGVR